jgi:RNA polymerase sigma-70 factor, ECF subfamily
MNAPGPDAHDLFEILVRENSRMLMAYVRSVTRNATVADDVWQETMMVAWRRIEDFDRSRPFGPWLRGIASRVMLGHNRKESHAVQVDTATLEYLDSRFEQMQSLRGDTLDEKLQALRDCVASLPEHYRTCIELRFMSGLKPQKLSEQIGIALESVKKRLVRAKGMLLTCIEQKMATEQS